jgi:hypothetical protein
MTDISAEMVERAKRWHDEAASLVHREPLPTAIVRGMLEAALESLKDPENDLPGPRT